MKRIISLFFLSIFLLTGCNNIEAFNTKESVISYYENLESYTLEASLLQIRMGKEIKSNVTVDYLKPNYYKICYEANYSKQILLKNDTGSFIINPKLNKEFKFDSNFPSNQIHGYLIESVIDKIKKDPDSGFKIEDEQTIITSKITDLLDITKLELYSNKKTKEPLKVICYDKDNNKIITVNITKFNNSPNLTKEMFNNNKVLDEQNASFITENISSEELEISVNYLPDDAILASKSLDSSTKVMCYKSNNLAYTIVIKKPTPLNNKVSVNVKEYDISTKGICVSNDNMTVASYLDYEFYIYSNTLSITERISVIDGIQIV